jgi:DNA modification methylase
MVGHPAKYTDNLLPVFANMLNGHKTVLDPFGGTGKIYSLLKCKPDLKITCIEIEPEWAILDPRMTLGNALNLPCPEDYFDAIVTSPTYGNRMADKLGKGKWALTRISYAASLGRELNEDNSGSLQWGTEYRKFHIDAWKEARRVLRNKGTFILNIKNHIRKGQEQLVTEWHCETLRLMGFEMMEHVKVETPSMKKGENREARVPYESVVKFVLYK